MGFGQGAKFVDTLCRSLEAVPCSLCSRLLVYEYCKDHVKFTVGVKFHVGLTEQHTGIWASQG